MGPEKKSIAHINLDIKDIYKPCVIPQRAYRWIVTDTNIVLSARLEGARRF